MGIDSCFFKHVIICCKNVHIMLEIFVSFGVSKWVAYQFFLYRLVRIGIAGSAGLFQIEDGLAKANNYYNI